MMATLVIGVLLSSPARPAAPQEIRGDGSGLPGQPEVSKADDFDGRLLHGVKLAEAGRDREAERVFRLLSRDYPGPEPEHNLAILEAWRGRGRMAVAALVEIVDRYPGYETAARNLERIRREFAGGEFDPLNPDSSRVTLELTSRLGSFELPTPVAAPSPPRPQPPAAEPPPAEPAAEPASTPVEAPPEPAAAPAIEAPPAVAPTVAPAQSEVPATADPTPALDDLRSQIEPLLTAWAAAWSQQRVKEYLGFYASDFQATGFASREAWEAVRRQRVAAPGFIEVEIELDSLKVRRTAPGEASATFVQHYRSDRYGDTVRKTLGLVRQEGAWRIQSEVSQ